MNDTITIQIWKQDLPIWRKWIMSTSTNLTTKARYKRIVTEFYYTMERPILAISGDDLAFYSRVDALSLSENTVKRRTRIIRAYWTFAQQQAEVAHE